MPSNKHAFALDPDHSALGVCRVCGRNSTHSSHTAVSEAAVLGEYLPYTDAMWAWTLRNGGVVDYYGGGNFPGTLTALIHLLGGHCTVDTDVSVLPHPGTVEQFADTYVGAVTVPVTLAVINCRCRLIEGLRWRVRQDLTLSEIVYAVVKAGETGVQVDPEIPPCPFPEHLAAWQHDAGPDTDHLVELVWRAAWYADWYRYPHEGADNSVWTTTLRILKTGLSGGARSADEVVADLVALMEPVTVPATYTDRYTVNSYYNWN